MHFTEKETEAQERHNQHVTLGNLTPELVLFITLLAGSKNGEGVAANGKVPRLGNC